MYAVSEESCDKLITIPIKINNHNYEAIIDSGSTKSFVSRRVAKELNVFTNTTNKVKINLLDKTFFNVNQSSLLIVECNNKIVQHNFYVYETLKHDVLIGLDFMRKTKLNIEFEAINPLYPYESEKIIIYELKLTQKLIIPKLSYISKEFSIPCKDNYGEFVPTNELSTKYNAFADSTIVDLRSNFTIKLYNNGLSNIVLLVGTKIGIVYPFTPIHRDKRR